MSFITCPKCGSAAIMGVGEPPEWERPFACLTCKYDGTHKMNVGPDGTPPLKEWLSRPTPVGEARKRRRH